MYIFKYNDKKNNKSKNKLLIDFYNASKEEGITFSIIHLFLLHYFSIIFVFCCFFHSSLISLLCEPELLKATNSSVRCIVCAQELLVELEEEVYINIPSSPLPLVSNAS